MLNVMISATDRALERYALDMFVSFKLSNPSIPMYCIISRGVSYDIREELMAIGVNLIEYIEEDTTHIKHSSLMIEHYLAGIVEYTKVMWVDIDVVVFKSLENLFKLGGGIAGHGGFNKGMFIDKTPSGKTYISPGIFIVDRTTARRMMNMYLKEGELSNSDGKFIRNHVENDELKATHIDTCIYNFCGDLIEFAILRDNTIVYPYKGNEYEPAIAHFSKHYAGRSKSYAIEEWKKNNLKAVRKSTPEFYRRAWRNDGIKITPLQLLLICDELEKIKPCNLLVFGTGHDSKFWATTNRGGRTVFLENIHEWIDKTRESVGNAEIYKVDYKTKLTQWGELLNNHEKLEMDLHESVSDTKWDIIIIDSPKGNADVDPGRMQSIYMASKLRSDDCHIYVHDTHREVESTYCHAYLGEVKDKVYGRTKRGTLTAISHYYEKIIREEDIKET